MTRRNLLATLRRPPRADDGMPTDGPGHPGRLQRWRDRLAGLLAGALRGALCGLLAAAVARGVAELVAAITGPQGSPVVAVGGSAIDLTPIPVKDFAIVHFGSHDKTVLVSGILLLLAGFAVVIGIAARRWLAAGLAGLAIFGALGVSAAATRPDAGLADVVPTLAGVAVSMITLVILVRTASDGKITLRRRAAVLPRPAGQSGPIGSSGPAGPSRVPGSSGSAWRSGTTGEPGQPGSPEPEEWQPPREPATPVKPGRRAFL